MVAGWRKPTWVGGVLAGSLALLIYLLTLTEVHTFDALSYVLDVDRKPLAELFHPHHLAYGPFGALVGALARAFDLAESARVPLQVANAIAGALGVALFFGLLRRETNEPILAAGGALMLGASHAFWYYGVEIEVYTIAALFLIIALSLMLKLLREPRWQLALGLGVIHGIAVLFHQTNVLLGFPILLTFWFASRQHSWWPLLLAYGLPAGAIVAGSYLGVGLGISGFRSWEALYGWMAGYATTGWWGGPIGGDTWADLGQGLSETITASGGLGLGLGLLGLLLIALPGLPRFPRETAILSLWLVMYGAFFIWWEPDNIEFWIASLPPFLLLLALGLHTEPQTERLEPRPMLVVRRVAAIVWIGLGLTAAAINFEAISRRGDAERDLQRVIATALAETSAAGDLLLVPDGLQELYLPYYEGRENVYSLNAALFESQGDWAQACGLVQSRVRATIVSGQAVLLSSEALRPPTTIPGGPVTPLERFGLRAEQVIACYEPFLSMFEPLPLAEGLGIEYLVVPSAQALLQQGGWDFRHGDWGWQLLNADSLGHSETGWEIRATIDPALLSPPVTIDLERYQTIEIELANETNQREAQLFLLDGAGQADETRSLRFILEEGAAQQTYQLSLREFIGSGAIGGLRLDPVDFGDEGRLWVRAIRFLP